VDEYLRPQHRFSHLFGDPPRRDVLDRIQQIADRNIARYGLVEDGASSAGEMKSS